jgi:GH35 family endo-1,4-beta-xylanase
MKNVRPGRPYLSMCIRVYTAEQQDRDKIRIWGVLDSNSWKFLSKVEQTSFDTAAVEMKNWIIIFSAALLCTVRA